MYEDFYVPYDQTRLWTGNLLRLVVSNFLLYASVYLMLPTLLVGIVLFGSCSFAEAGGMIALFGVGMFLPGVFNSYLIDAFPRHRLALWTAGLLAVSHLCYPWVVSLAGLGLLRLGQGVLFGVLTLVTGSTLVIDVTATRRRTEANAAFAWSGRLGMVMGLMLGLFVESFLPFEHLQWLATGLGLLATVALLRVSVPFRAPLHVPLVSMDRFLTLRSALPGVNLMLLSGVMGVVISRGTNGWFYACMALGLLLALGLLRILFRYAPARAEVELGQAAMLGGFLLLMLSNGLMTSYIAGLLLGLGMGTTASHLLIQMVSLPLHCGRGTGNQTYQLLWEAGVMGGFFYGAAWTGVSQSDLYGQCLALSALLLVLYEVLTHPWVKKRMEEINN